MVERRLRRVAKLGLLATLLILAGLGLDELLGSRLPAQYTATWHQTGGPNGGRANILLVDTQNPSVVYAGTDGGVFASRDGSATWELTSSGLPGEQSVRALTLDPRNASQRALYAGTGTGKVYKSVDAGLNWVQVNGGLAGDVTITSMVVHYGSDIEDDRPAEALFAGTNGGGVFQSTDGGIEWTPVNSGLDDLRVQVLALAPERSGVLYAATGAGISHLDLAGGLAWQSAEEGLPEGTVNSIAIDPTTPTTVCAATEAEIGKLFRSTDGGRTWAAIGQGSLPTNARIQALAFHLQQAGPNLLYAGTDGGVLYSDDGGFHWQAMNDGLPQPANVLALLVDGQRSRVYASISSRGVYSSDVRSVSRFNWSPLMVAILGSAALTAILLAGRQAYYSSASAQQRALEKNWPLAKLRIQSILYHQNWVTPGALRDMPTSVRLGALQRYVQEQRDEDLILTADPPMLLPANAQQVGDLIRDWQAAQRRRHDPTAFGAVVGRLANQLCQLLGFTLIDSRSYKSLHGYVIRAPALRLNVPTIFPIIFLRKRNLVEEDIRSLDDLMAILRVPSYLALLVVPDEKEAGLHGRALKTRFATLRYTSAHNYILLEYQDLYSIFVAKDAEKRFISIMLEQVDLTVVSPYMTAGPVRENMFFDREYELTTITRTIKDGSFALTGTRKIGKTSVLTKLHRTLTALPEFRPLYLGCQAVQDYEDFYDTAETACRVPWLPRTPEHLVELVSALKGGRNEQLLVFLLDEVDALLQYDRTNHERLLRVCRALSQEGRCRFVFCGGRLLHAQQHSASSALFDFCHTIHLSYLKPPDTARIVAEPMQEMGIAFEEPNTLIQRIVDLSACHPNLVQYVCHQLIVHVSGRGDRLIRLSDVDDIERSTKFGAYFAELMWGNTTPLERLVTLLMLDQSSMTMPQIVAALREKGLDITLTEIERALQGLTFCSILSQDGQSYSFAAPAFPSIVTVTQDVTALTERMLQDVASCAGTEAQAVAQGTM